DELHRRVVVVEQDDLEHLGALGLLLGLFEDLVAGLRFLAGHRRSYYVRWSDVRAAADGIDAVPFLRDARGRQRRAVPRVRTCPPRPLRPDRAPAPERAGRPLRPDRDVGLRSAPPGQPGHGSRL